MLRRAARYTEGVRSFGANLVLCLIVAAYGAAAGLPRLVRGCAGEACAAEALRVVEVQSAANEPHCPLCADPAQDAKPVNEEPAESPCCPPGCACCLGLPPSDVPGPGVQAPVREQHFEALSLRPAPIVVEPEREAVTPCARAFDGGPPGSVMRSLRSWRLVI